MTCRTDACRQGRKPCPTPGVCTDKPGRIAAAVRYIAGYADVFLRWGDHRAAVRNAKLQASVQQPDDFFTWVEDMAHAAWTLIKWGAVALVATVALYQLH